MDNKIKNNVQNHSSGTYIIAEAGTSHQGDLKKAEELILAAKESGADAVKFQWFYAHELVHPKTGLVNLPGGSIPLFDRFRQLEQPFSFLEALHNSCREKKIDFLCTPFGLSSFRDLTKLTMPALKIASPELNHLPLLAEARNTGIPVLLSTGVSKLSDIEEALENLGPAPVTLLHCVTAYPAPPEEYNLLTISALRNIFGCPAGLSDHSEDPLLVPGLAALLNASVIEKHICLGKEDGGLDDPFALNPAEFHIMSEGIKYLNQCSYDDGINWLRQYYSENLINMVLGTGQKTLSASEKANYKTTNRSIMTTAPIKKGEAITKENTALLRSEKELSPGLHPRYWKELLGVTAESDIPDGTGILWQHVLRKTT